MQPAIAIRELNGLLERLEQLAPEWRSPEVIEWRSRLDNLLEASFGADSRAVKELQHVRFGPRGRDPNTHRQSINEMNAFAKAKNVFIGKIKGAINKLELEAAATP